jgi:hypothetical protein
MNRITCALLGVVLLSAGSGCCLIDRMLCNGWGCPWGGCGSHCGSCEDCCSDCGDGCQCWNDRGCRHCGVMRHHHADRGLPRGAGGEYVGPAGPPTGAITYPYYTTRGPRDFLAKNPPGIGP